MEPFPITIVPPDARRYDEQLGTKPKFWFERGDGATSLFKRGRPNEDWSEKVGSELATQLGLPAAKVGLALSDGVAGVVSEAFLDRHAGDALFHGNELLTLRTPAYPADQDYRVRQHTLEAVFDVLTFVEARPWDQVDVPVEVADACDQFVGYLLLDAWIGNTDRHHENWAVVRRAGSPRLLLAPTYDHASALGIRETEARISNRLDGRDPRVTTAIYANRCRSAFYPPEGSEPRTTFDAFDWALRARPRAGSLWLERLRGVTEETVKALLDRVPADRISVSHRRFADKILSHNRARLLGLGTGTLDRPE